MTLKFFHSLIRQVTTRTNGGENRKVANNSLYRVSSGRVQDGLKSLTSEEERKKQGANITLYKVGFFVVFFFWLKIHLWTVQCQEFLIKNTS